MQDLVRQLNRSGKKLSKGHRKIAEYIEETEKYYRKLLKQVKACPEYNNAAWLLDYQIRSLIAMAKRIR